MNNSWIQSMVLFVDSNDASEWGAIHQLFLQSSCFTLEPSWSFILFFFINTSPTSHVCSVFLLTIHKRTMVQSDQKNVRIWPTGSYRPGHLLLTSAPRLTTFWPEAGSVVSPLSDGVMPLFRAQGCTPRGHGRTSPPPPSTAMGVHLSVRDVRPPHCSKGRTLCSQGHTLRSQGRTTRSQGRTP